MDIYLYDLKKNYRALENKKFKAWNIVVTKINQNYDLFIQKDGTLKKIASETSVVECPDNSGEHSVFSFDPISGRKGNIKILKYFSTVFKDETIVDFFNNAIKIASFTADSWDATVLSRLYGFEVKKKEPVPNITFVPISKEGNHTSANTTKRNSLIDSNIVNRIEDWRKKEADRLNVAEWAILRYRDIFEIAQKKPTSFDELKACGLKAEAIKSYGQLILSMVNPTKDNIENNVLIQKEKVGDGLVSPLNDLSTFFSANKTSNTKKKEKLPSKIKKSNYKLSSTEKTSISLFHAGLTVGQIVINRNLTTGTIHKHLAAGIKSGHIDVYQLVSSVAYERIEKKAKECWPNYKLSDIYHKLNGAYSFEMILYVVSDIERSGYVSEPNLIPIKEKTFEEYITDFSTLSVNRAHGKIAPHKVVLIISILNLMDTLNIVNQKVFPSGPLEQEFEKVWKQFVISDDHICSLAYPFFHMKNEPFWTLVPHEGKTLKKEYGTVRAIRSDIECAMIDSVLFNFLQTRSNRVKIRHLLIKTYLM